MGKKNVRFAVFAFDGNIVSQVLIYVRGALFVNRVLSVRTRAMMRMSHPTNVQLFDGEKWARGTNADVTYRTRIGHERPHVAA